MCRKKIFPLIISLIFVAFNFTNAQDSPVNRIINVLDAENIGTFAPATMNAGSSHRVWVTMKNTGSSTWNPFTDRDMQYNLRPFGASERALFDWGVTAVPLSAVVQPGEIHRFEFTVNAPWTTGTYDFQWRMSRGIEFFGDVSKHIAVTVVSDPVVSVVSPSDIYSTFISQSVPAEMVAGERYNIVLTMSNTGRTAWVPGYSWLTFHNSNTSYDDMFWGMNRVGIDRNIPPGEPAVFNFTVTAPERPGFYDFQWRMGNANGTFGELSEGVKIVVTPNPRRAVDANDVSR
jgi:hypothetical protein